MIVLDTNVVSEPLQPSSSPIVAEWLEAQDSSSCFLTAVTEAELLVGVFRLPDGKRKRKLETGVEQILAMFHGQILPFEEVSAREYATIVARRTRLGRPISQPDAMIAAIASTNGAALATRNVRDFEHCGLSLIDPWKPPRSKHAGH